MEVRNGLASARPGEVLALSLADLRRRRPTWRPQQLAARLAGGAALPVQLYASDGGAAPDQLLVQFDVPARGRVTLELVASTAGTAPAPPPPCLQARAVPERADDFAWENAQVAYRIYGPALQASGEIASGIDVWSKRPGGCALDDWYRRDAAAQRRHDPSLSYHRDDGRGLDSYAVARTPGDGGTAAWVAGRPAYSANMTRTRITARGPIRLRFEVDYAPWRAGRAWVREHKIVVLDAGSHMNRQTVRYRLAGAARLTVAAGLAVHAGAQAGRQGTASWWVWDTPQRPDAGRIATGLVVAPGDAGRARLRATPEARWALFRIADGGVIHFASGAGWSKGDMPDAASWRRYLADYRRRWAHPLAWRWLGR